MKGLIWPGFLFFILIDLNERLSALLQFFFLTVSVPAFLGTSLNSQS